MPISKVKKIDEKKISRSAFAFNNYLDDYFGLIILVLVLVVFIGSFFLIWSPRFLKAMDTIDNVKTQLKDERTQLEKYADSIARYKEAYANVSNEDKDKVDDMIGPWHKYPAIYQVDLLMTFQKLIAQTDCLLTNVTTNDVDAKVDRKKKVSKKVVDSEDKDLSQGIVKVEMDFELANIDYDGLKNLLSLLEKKLRLADVLSVQFSPENETASIKLATYRFADED